MLSEPHHMALSWAPYYYAMDMETLVFWASDWLKTACVLSALFWVAYRAYQVLSKPVEDLIALLGLEVPVAPTVSLAGIRADGVLLHWKPPDAGQRGSVVKYIIRINGIDIGHVSHQETSVTIENLQSDHQYVMRIVTVNSANFQAPSTPVRVRTLPASSDLFYSTAPPKDSHHDADAEYTPTPIIRPNKNLVDVVMNPATAPVMTREHSNSTSRVRRVESGRRNSPASQTAEQAQSAREAADTTESIKQLTEKLDGLRRDIDDVEKQMQEEEEDFQAQKAALQEKRDDKRAALKEKEDTSRDLRKEVASLERSNASAQQRRANQEKLLRQKEADRKKLKDDVARWTREAVELRAAAGAIETERAEYEAEAAKRIQALKDKHADEIQTNKSLEEVIREKGSQIKALEKESESLLEGDAEGDMQAAEEIEAVEEARQWNAKLAYLQQAYTQAWNTMNQAQMKQQEMAQKLQTLQQSGRRLSQSQIYPPVSLQDAPATHRRNSQRSRPVSVREPYNMSAAPGGFVHSSGPTFNTSINNVSPQFPNATPYFNINNGMSLPPLRDEHNRSLSQADIESLTGGAPMSPTAGALLPSGLFGDDSGLTDAEDDMDDDGLPLDTTLRSRPILPGLGAPGTFDQGHTPSTPISVQSRSPFASPRDSGQLAYFPQSTEKPVDSDKRSIHSTSSSFVNPPPTTRFGGLFGLNRQRGKTLSDQGPALGTLKPSQSQSLPRQDAGGLDPIGTQRRRGSTEGAWYNHLLRSSKTEPVESTATESPKHVATRKRAFNMFGLKSGDAWPTPSLGQRDRPSSPRQGSTNSGEVSLLPRPSTDSHTRFGWPGSGDAFGARNSPLGYTDWSMPNNSTPWSRVPSRRPSLQHGSAISLVNDELLQGGFPDFQSTTKSPTQAPIGTRPQSSAAHLPQADIPPTPPKALNPAAPNFTSIFTRGDKSEEAKAEKARRAAEKAEKAGEKAAEKEAKKAAKKEEKKAFKAEKSDKALRKEKERLIAHDSTGNDSGNNSLDYTRSVSTVDLSESSPRVSMDRTVSLTSSDAQIFPEKETFMQKLSRKSSSNQFLQFSKGSLGKASLFSKKLNEIGTPVTPAETDEDGNFLTVKSVDSSVANSPAMGTPKDKSSAFGWSSIKRMGKRGDKTPSLHESIASETTGDEGDDAADKVNNC